MRRWLLLVLAFLVPQGQFSSGSSVSTNLSGTAVLGTSSISATNCASVVTVAVTGVQTTDSIQFSLNATATGYTSATASGLHILAVPTANNVNFYVCNPTAGAITPAAATVNFRVVR